MSHRRVGLALLMASALVAGLLPPKALADSNARIVRLSYVDGEAQIDRRDGRGFEHAFLNMPLGPGTRVATRDDGRAEIEFEDMSTVRLTPGTLIEAQSLDLRSSGAKYTLVDLQDGTAYFNIRKLEGDNDFRVTTGRREFSLTRASRFRLRVDRSQVVLAVFKGEVEVVGEGSRLTVRKDETLTLDLADPARYFLAKGVSGDRYDDWDRERDEYRDRYASVGNYRGYSSAYSYGVSDLNYWGSYAYISGYGYMWRPHYYGVNWNPFNDGAWYWYPGYGWMWVSAYPWGWMPFRYGNWYYIGGHGWCWRPAHHWNTWSPVVVVSNPPPGHRVLTPPAPGGRRDPVVVGRGPATILPREDPGPGRRGVRDPNVLGRKGGNPAGGSGSGVVGTPGSGPGGTPSGGSGSGVSAGNGSGVSVGSGGSGQPASDSGRRPSGREREIELEEAIRNARERRSVGGQSGGVITNSGSGSSGSGSGSAGAQGVSGGSQSSGGSVSIGGGGSGATSPPGDSSPASGRGRIPESRRQLPPSITRDAPTSGSSSGLSGSSSSGSSGGSSSGSGSGATSPATDPAPSSRGGRPQEPRREAQRENFMQSSGSSGSASSGSGSSGSGSSRPSSGSSGGSSSSSSGSSASSGGSGSSGHSSPSSRSSSGPGASSSPSSSGSSGSSSGGSRPSSGSSSAGSQSSSGGRSSSSSSSSTKSTSPK